MDPDVLIAARDGRVETLRELLANGADPNASNRIGRTALHFACMYVDTERGFYGFTNDLDGIELDRVERAHSGAWRAPQVALEFR